MVLEKMEEHGISPRTVLRFLEAQRDLHQLHSVTVVKDDQVVLEAFQSPFQQGLYRDLLSIAKSAVSLAVGVAVDRGRLSLEDRILPFFRDDLPEKYDPRLEQLTVRNLLTMSASSAYTSSTFRGKGGNWRKLYFSLPLPDDPGKAFHYDTGSPYILACLVSRVMGQSCEQVLHDAVFAPMGVDCRWSYDPDGNIAGGWDCFLRTEDFVKLGKLLLHHGNWNGRQLISEEYMRQAMACQTDTLNDPGMGWCYGYGFLFWRWPDDAYGCFGAFGQLLICSEKKNLYVVTTGGMSIQDTQRLALSILETLIGEAQTHPLPPDAAGHAQLQEALAQFTLPLPAGEASAPEPEALLLNRRVGFSPNPAGVHAMLIRRAETDQLEVQLELESGTIQFRAAYGKWQLEQVKTGNPLLTDHAFAYAWAEGNTLVLMDCWRNSPYQKEYRFSVSQEAVDGKLIQSVALPGLGNEVTFTSRA